MTPLFIYRSVIKKVFKKLSILIICYIFFTYCIENINYKKPIVKELPYKKKTLTLSGRGYYGSSKLILTILLTAFFLACRLPCVPI